MWASLHLQAVVIHRERARARAREREKTERHLRSDTADEDLREVLRECFCNKLYWGSDVILFLITSPPPFTTPKKKPSIENVILLERFSKPLSLPPPPPCISMQRRTNALLAVGGHPPMRSPVTTMSESGGQGVTQKWPCGGRPRSSLCVGKSKQSGSTGARP